MPIKESSLNNIFRVAATFDSPRLQGNASQLYRLFKASQTLETNSITSRLIVTEFDPPIFVEKESANLYIPDHATELKIYLTDDEIEQESCFNAKLPRRLAQWIMSEPDRPSLDPASPRIVAAVQSVLSVSRRALSKVLDEHGIVQIDVPDEPETTTLPLRISEPETVTMVTTEIASQSLRSRSEPVPIPNRQVFSDRSPQLSETTTIGPIHSPQPVSDRASYINSDPSFEELGPSNITYMQLLLHVVEGAAQVAFPTCPRIADNGFFELDGAQQSNYQGDRFSLRQYHKLERDKRVGAAGELFVSNLMLPLAKSCIITIFERSLSFFCGCCPILRETTGRAIFATTSTSTRIMLISLAGMAEKRATLYTMILRACLPTC